MPSPEVNTPNAPDPAAIDAYLAKTAAELLVYIDPAHMSYLLTYLGRADALHAAGRPATEVLAELARASAVYAGHGPIFLAKWPPTQFRRRRLEPLEVAIAAGASDSLARQAEIFGADAMQFFAGIAADAADSEAKALSAYFRDETCADAADLAGALAVFYWLTLAAVMAADSEGLTAIRRRAARMIDDFGHLAGHVASGALARMRTIHEVVQALRPARTDAASVLATGVVRHVALHAVEFGRAAAADPEAVALGRGSLDRSALALLALGSALGISAHQALADAGASRQWLAYAAALGHTPGP